ncbi:MAG: aminomethyl-transferring glycine dehydrogenase subunit GcvPA [Vallitaleaceae bacterium]|nr:aminomethyl-transferring glycine dehydrogenase subunit GcvPA [Vallitaleaceae bacterium]
MHPYIPHTEEDKKQMLQLLGMKSTEELFVDIDQDIRMKEELKLPKKLSELELIQDVKELAKKNKFVKSYIGAGAYAHYIPEIVNQLAARSEFYTAYTPYQPEVSQGTLGVIFEYQSMITELTGLHASNASHYDGATAAAEGLFMAVAQTRRNKVLLAEPLHPETKKVILTYMKFRGIECEVIPQQNGLCHVEEVLEACHQGVAAVLVQSPNFYGSVEDLSPFVERVHAVGALLVHYVDLFSLALYKTPGEWGADIAVGDAQGFGNPLNFGGPYLGFIACSEKLIRKLPGRIVGKTKDVDGKIGYVLTLQAREQHIRREKATSNITSNQALNALRATLYLATMGREGYLEVAKRSMTNANYFAEELVSKAGFHLYSQKPFYQEFVVSHPEIERVYDALLEQGILLGLQVPEGLLIATSELTTKKEMDDIVDRIRRELQ